MTKRRLTTDDLEDAEQDRPDEVRQNVYVERRLTRKPKTRKITEKDLAR